MRLLAVTLGVTATSAVDIRLPSLAVVNTVQPTYASWNIDPSCNRGFHVTNFSNPNLIAAAAGLHPSRLRFGGSGADNLVYSLTPGAPECAAIDPAVCLNSPDYTTPGCLNASHWEGLFALAAQSRSDFIFGVSFDLLAACAAGGPSYVWNSSNVERLLAYTSQHGQTLYGMELGNEANNNRDAPCNLAPSSQATAFATLGKLTSGTGIKLIGPDTGYLDWQAWLTAFLPLATSSSALHAVTHHVYTGLTRANYNSPPVLDSCLPEALWYADTVQRLAPGVEVWAGEDGPIGGGNDGTCGKDSVCGTFASVAWYADNLAIRALHGFVQYQRQDLFGGAYGLVSSRSSAMALGAEEPVVLRPDFWVNYLWKRCLGVSVLNATSSSPMVRAYAFTGAPPSEWAAGGCSASPLQLLLINLSSNSSTPVTLPTAGLPSAFVSYQLTPVGGEPFAAQALLNGASLPLEVDVARADPAAFLHAIPVPPQAGIVAQGLVLPPLSTTFLCFK